MKIQVVLFSMLLSGLTPAFASKEVCQQMADRIGAAMTESVVLPFITEFRPLFLEAHEATKELLIESESLQDQGQLTRTSRGAKERELQELARRRPSGWLQKVGELEQEILALDEEGKRISTRQTQVFAALEESYRKILPRISPRVEWAGANIGDIRIWPKNSDPVGKQLDIFVRFRAKDIIYFYGFRGTTASPDLAALRNFIKEQWYCKGYDIQTFRSSATLN